MGSLLASFAIWAAVGSGAPSSLTQRNVEAAGRCRRAGRVPGAMTRHRRKAQQRRQHGRTPSRDGTGLLGNQSLPGTGRTRLPCRDDWIRPGRHPASCTRVRRTGRDDQRENRGGAGHLAAVTIRRSGRGAGVPTWSLTEPAGGGMRMERCPDRSGGMRRARLAVAGSSPPSSSAPAAWPCTWTPQPTPPPPAAACGLVYRRRGGRLQGHVAGHSPTAVADSGCRW